MTNADGSEARELIAGWGARNRVVHGYDQVDFDILWDVMELRLPPLIAELRRILDVKNDNQKKGKPGDVQ